MGDDPATGRTSFWTTLPGVLTGVAALITAVVGAAALFLGHGHAGTTPTANTPGPSTAGASTAGASGSPSHEDVTLAPGDTLDVDTGLAGKGVEGFDTYWGAGQLSLYGRRHAIAAGALDEAGCAATLAHHSDSYLTRAQLAAGGTAVCLTTDQGVLAGLRISAPDARDVLDVQVTVWR